MFKEYLGREDGLPLVGIHYRGRMNCAFPAIHIYGVACACWDKNAREMKWRRNTADNLDRLPEGDSIRGGNVRSPILVELWQEKEGV